MKPVLLIQPRFGGDVIFCMKIAAVYAQRGHRVIFPIEDQFAWIRDGLNLPPGVEMPLLGEDFEHKARFQGVRYQADLISSRGDQRFHFSPIEDEDCIFLALESSWRKSPDDTMIVKYLIAGVDYRDWSDYVTLKRDFAKEQRLLDHLGVTEGRQFTLINENCRTRTIHVPAQGDVIRMSVVPGFTMFDWAGVLERAKEIITVDTSLVLLIEALKLPQPLQMINRYEPPTFQPIAPLLRLNWRLALTVDDLRLGQAAPALMSLAQRLQSEGRAQDALAIYDHLAELNPSEIEPVRGQVAMLNALGLTVKALERLTAFRERAPGAVAEADLKELAKHGVELFNDHLRAGRMEQAEVYASALARLLPNAAPMQAAAMNCNQLLGRGAAAAEFARALLAVLPEDASGNEVLAQACREAGDLEGEFRHRQIAVNARPNNLHPLVWMKGCHDVASRLMFEPLTSESRRQVQETIAIAHSIALPPNADDELRGWLRHYRLLLDAIDLEAIAAPTPAEVAELRQAFVDGTGASVTLAELRERAQGADAVFFAAADEGYVDLYARWYVLSVLKHCDVGCLVMIHVAGGAGRLAEIVRKVGVADPRLVFTADDFDAAKVTLECFDAPPKGVAAKPIAHYQCVRFQRLGWLLNALGRPVFVSDIDLLLQRGVSDLLARCADADIVFNENVHSASAGARITANLMLVRPTEPARILLRFLRAYIDQALAGAEVTRWIDQVALLHGRQHLAAHAPHTRVAYFDTDSDINNVMYRSYRANPFRFFSLYHGFDTSTLEDALPPAPAQAADAAPAKPARRARAARQA